MLREFRQAANSPYIRYPLDLVRREFAIFAVLAGVFGGVWAFVTLAEEVVEGETRKIDEAILLSLRSADTGDPIGPSWLDEVARDVTALGSTTILTLVTLVAVVFLLMVSKRGAAFLLFISVAGGMALTNFLKFGFERPRPDLVAHLMETFTPSFPSGHASGAAVTYLTLGALLTRFQPRRRVKLYLMSVAIAITILVGVTRVYLGVHWPTDVVAGWCIGAIWASLIWVVALYLQSRGQVEKEADATQG